MGVSYLAKSGGKNHPQYLPLKPPSLAYQGTVGVMLQQEKQTVVSSWKLYWKHVGECTVKSHLCMYKCAHSHIPSKRTEKVLPFSPTAMLLHNLIRTLYVRELQHTHELKKFKEQWAQIPPNPKFLQVNVQEWSRARKDLVR